MLMNKNFQTITYLNKHHCMLIVEPGLMCWKLKDMVMITTVTLHVCIITMVPMQSPVWIIIIVTKST